MNTATKRNEGGRYSSKNASNWYADIEAANIRTAEMAEQAAVAALAHQVGNAVAAMPEAAARITKAAALVQAGDVYPLTSGSFLVGSQRSTDAYLVTRGPWSCECPDHTHRQHLCKHIVAVQLTVRLGAQYTPSYN